MGTASIRAIAAFGLASGLCLGLSSLPAGAAMSEQAPEQVVKNAPLPGQHQSAGDRPTPTGPASPPRVRS